MHGMWKVQRFLTLNRVCTLHYTKNKQKYAFWPCHVTPLKYSFHSLTNNHQVCVSSEAF